MPTTGSSDLAIVALGSNLAAPSENVLSAIARLREFSATPLLVSSLWKTPPVDCPPGSPDFVNAVIALHPHEEESPESLLSKLQALEREFGRQPKQVLNEARPLDLDLIVFKDEVRQTPSLTLPHPRAHERLFVLKPLAEILPNLTLPGRRETVMELIKSLGPDSAIIKLRSAG